MFKQDEYDEGRKDAKVDFKNKIKRDLNRYPSDHYRHGYLVQLASCCSAEKRKKKGGKK